MSIVEVSFKRNERYKSAFYLAYLLSYLQLSCFQYTVVTPKGLNVDSIDTIKQQYKQNGMAL